MYLSNVLVHCLELLLQASDSRAFGLHVPRDVSPVLGRVNTRIHLKVTHNNIFLVGIVVGILKFHRDIV